MAIAKVFALHTKATRQEVGDDLNVYVLQKTRLILSVLSFTSLKKEWKNKTWVFNAVVKRIYNLLWNIF